ncbi:MAG: DUF3253 domain-containing protein [Gammaproteobacteria bacterium]
MKEQKICCACGRLMEYRKKWAANWDEVKYCSQACRGKGVPEQLMNDIMVLLDKRGSGKTICPSEILDADNKADKQKIERVRSAARLLAHDGKIVIKQKGKVVDPTGFKGPIRLAKK